ncbi:MAG TPA: sensor histidine kinase [Tahibacter sp.]|uniref:sensor histidine kinase n=1 Tax=Tahibacter sp. TaxID=2056211 RepID=UPI002C1642F4|nr:sensor histidine kinase [Tahibacter sp.]HSX60022.1 sensor histidine kinase [Tahibacter sp.]
MNADDGAVAALNQRIDELMRQHAALLTRLQQDQRRTRHLARSVWRIEEQARRRIARELHDGVGQNLVALMRQLDTIASQLPRNAEASHGGLLRARELVQATLEDTRSLSRLLRPQILDDLGLEAALRWLARSVDGLCVELELPEDMPAFDDDTSTLLFRVAQEALSNAARHAGASQVHIAVTLRPHGQSLRMDIRDDGRGCDLSAALAAGRDGEGGGLGGIRDRVDLFDGRLDLQSVPGQGFNICIELPLRSTARSEP